MKKFVSMLTKFKYQFEVFAGVILVLFLGTIGYMIIENWSFQESFYMTVITITTVGFGETKPLSVYGRGFTILLIFIGLSTAASFAANVTKEVVREQLKIYLGGNKMKKKIAQLENHYIVCGFGNIGKTICNTFKEYEIPFVVIEQDEDICQIARDANFLIIKGNATEDSMLIDAGITKAKGVISVLNHDSDNLFVSLAARELTSEIFIISRGNEPNVEKRMLRAGANIVVYPLKLGGEQIAHIVAQRDIENEQYDYENCPDGIMGYSMKTYHHFLNKTITVKEAISKIKAMQVLAIRKSNGNQIDNPSRSTIIEKDDNILFLIKEKTAKRP